MTFVLPTLPYTYDALEPIIDAKTMEIHHTKHHQAYINNLNNALEGSDYTEWSIEELLTKINELPEDMQTAIRNHGGGYRNHKLFWEIMTPNETPMSEKMSKKITQSFGSVEDFSEMFIATAWAIFGSGRARLVFDKKGSLSIMTTANQDNPLSEWFTPILWLDVWEHAYYLHYQNRRADYIKSWMKIINWKKVEELMTIK